jgi:ATP-dependent Clp protease protease subunit
VDDAWGRLSRWGVSLVRTDPPLRLLPFAETAIMADRQRPSENESHDHSHQDSHDEHPEDRGPIEIAFVGDLTDGESELTDRLLSVEPGGECTIYFDSPGGSPYCAMSLVSLLQLRGIQATGIVTGECSSAALWPFAACKNRLVTPYSVFLFHPMKWQSEEHIGITEAAEWSRHFAHLEKEMDILLGDLFGCGQDKIDSWIRTHRYISGREIAEAGLAELISLNPLPHLLPDDRGEHDED